MKFLLLSLLILVCKGPLWADRCLLKIEKAMVNDPSIFNDVLDSMRVSLKGLKGVNEAMDGDNWPTQDALGKVRNIFNIADDFRYIFGRLIVMMATQEEMFLERLMIVKSDSVKSHLVLKGTVESEWDIVLDVPPSILEMMSDSATLHSLSPQDKVHLTKWVKEALLAKEFYASEIRKKSKTLKSFLSAYTQDNSLPITKRNVQWPDNQVKDLLFLLQTFNSKIAVQKND